MTNTPENFSVVHVDDESHSRDAVKRILANFPEIDYKEGFSDAETALSYIVAEQPDIAFLDIEMPGKDGLWLANAIKELRTAIVFITAHTRYAIEAFEACALHYLLKPATENKLADAILRFKAMHVAAHHYQADKVNEFYYNYFVEGGCPQKVYINNLQKTTIVNLEDLVFMESSGNYTFFKMIDGEKHVSSRNLKTYEIALHKHPNFLRVHRSFIINKSFVQSVKRDKKRTALLLKDGSQLQVSFQKKDSVLKEIFN